MELKGFGLKRRKGEKGTKWRRWVKEGKG